MEQTDGVRSFLKKAAEKSGVEFNEDKANTLIRSYNNDYDKLVKDVAKKVGYQDNQLDEFRDRAFKEYGITPAIQSEATPRQYSEFQNEFDKNQHNKIVQSQEPKIEKGFLEHMDRRCIRSSRRNNCWKGIKLIRVRNHNAADNCKCSRK